MPKGSATILAALVFVQRVGNSNTGQIESVHSSLANESRLLQLWSVKIAIYLLCLIVLHIENKELVSLHIHIYINSIIDILLPGGQLYAPYLQI